ncbi:DUF2716 domain-containing protein [Streptomyces sp. NPDC048527]|uniref:DUF2716 domain-containing protein n=1 Tax=Streptomyces sp. NPDC048527 TaxID=3365568 RepID=UPI003716DE1E
MKRKAPLAQVGGHQGACLVGQLEPGDASRRLCYESPVRLVEVVEQGLASCVGSPGTLFALDWQHTSYRFAPQEAGGPGQAAWPLSPYPDGDYYIFLSEGFRFGSFGHPWEESLCLFGEELLDAASTEVNEVLGRSAGPARQ